MTTFKKLFCFIFGHDTVQIGEKDTGRSIIGASKCIRCGLVEQYQFDYGI